MLEWPWTVPGLRCISANTHTDNIVPLLSSGGSSVAFLGFLQFLLVRQFFEKPSVRAKFPTDVNERRHWTDHACSQRITEFVLLSFLHDLHSALDRPLLAKAGRDRLTDRLTDCRGLVDTADSDFVDSRLLSSRLSTVSATPVTKDLWYIS